MILCASCSRPKNPEPVATGIGVRVFCCKEEGIGLRVKVLLYESRVGLDPMYDDPSSLGTCSSWDKSVIIEGLAADAGRSRVGYLFRIGRCFGKLAHGNKWISNSGR